MLVSAKKDPTLHASRHRVISYHDMDYCELQGRWKLAHHQPSFKAING
jgi:hypothetical protein